MSSPPWPTLTATAITSAPVFSARYGIATEVSSPPENASTTRSVMVVSPFLVYGLPTRAGVAASAAPGPVAAAGSRATTTIVSSPAIVPMISGRPDRSNALARNCAAPGGVRSTTRLPLASAPVSSSRSSRLSRSGACSAVRCGPWPSSGMTYAAAEPSVPRTFTAPSSSRSRESVAWVVVSPSAASSSPSSPCERTARSRISATMRAWRAVLDSGWADHR